MKCVFSWCLCMSMCLSCTFSIRQKLIHIETLGNFLLKICFMIMIIDYNLICFMIMIIDNVSQNVMPVFMSYIVLFNCRMIKEV